jgi:hypothetical protein
VALFGLIKKAFYTRGILGLAWLMPKSNGMHGMDTWIHYSIGLLIAKFSSVQSWTQGSALAAQELLVLQIT